MERLKLLHSCFLKSGYFTSLFCLFICTTTFGAFEDPFPRKFVDSHLKNYSEEECQLIAQDLKNIHQLSFRNKKPAIGQPYYIATAGGPGASKSTILETFFQDYWNFVYADPDQRSLRFMINTNLQSNTNYKISQATSLSDLLKGAYDKWRAASNYIAYRILNEAYANGYNIAHGSTSTSKEVSGLYERLKKKNYKIILLLCGSTDQNRIDALNSRTATQQFVQNADDDTINKGKLFWERLPVYFHYGDEVHIYWTQEFKKGSVKAATYDKKKGLRILDPEAYESFIKQYEIARGENKELLPFEALLPKM
jgi:hypothetical protein